MRVLTLVAQPLWAPALVEQSLARSADVMQRAQRLDDPVLLFWAANSRINVAGQVGDIEEIDRCLNICDALVQQVGQATLDWYDRYSRCMRSMAGAHVDEIERLANEAFQIGIDSGQPDALIIFGGQLHTVNWQRGTLDSMIPILETMVADAPDVADIARSGLAQAYAESGRLADAQRLLDQVVATNFDLPMNALWTSTVTGYAVATAECRHVASAAALFDILAPWADQWAFTGAAIYAPVSLCVGFVATVLGRYQDAEKYYAQSVAMTHRTGNTFMAASTDRWWGQMLAERNGPGDLDRAREMLSRARAVCVANGYAYIERRATEALQRIS